MLYIIISDDMFGPSLLVRCVKKWEDESRLRLLAQDLSTFTSRCHSG